MAARKKESEAKSTEAFDAVEDLKRQHGLISVASQSAGSIDNSIVDVITFCEDPRFLNLNYYNMKLFISQRVVLKAFYMGSRGNENLALSKEEWDWLYANANNKVCEIDKIIEKIKLKESRRGSKTPIRFSELTLVLGRRASKTALAAIIAVYEAYKVLVLNNGDPYTFYKIPKEKEIAIINVATARDQAHRLFAEIRVHIRRSPFFANRIDTSTAEIIRLFTDLDLKNRRENTTNINIHGSIIVYCGHSNPDSLRGWAAICIVFDELAFYDESTKISGREFYEALAPSVAQFAEFGDGIKVEISSPGPKTGIFYELWKLSLSSVPEADSMLSFRMPTWLFNPLYNYENPELASARARDKAKFDVEYGAEWPEGGLFGFYFPDDLIKEAIELGQKNGVIEEFEPSYAGEYFFHVDPALTNNNYALVGVRKEAYYDPNGLIQPRIILAFVKVWSPVPGAGLNILEIDQEIGQICLKFRPIIVGYDQYNSAGSMALLRHKGVNLIQHAFNRGYKMRIYQNLKDLMIKKALYLYEDSYLVPELRHLKYRPTPRGISIGADTRGDVPTDDCVDCLAGAAFLASSNYYRGLPQTVTVYTGFR
jgi:hypothetical protein